MSVADVDGGGLRVEKKQVSGKRCPKIALTFKAAQIEPQKSHSLYILNPF